MAGKKEIAEGIVEQALKLVTGGAETAAPKVAYHATQEPFENYDWSRLGQTTKENTSGTSVEDWALALARLGPWSHEKPLSKKIGMKTDLPVMLTGKEREFKSLDHLAKAISRHGGPEALRGKLVSKGYGHVSVNDEEFGGKSYIGLSPEYFSITKAAGGRTGYQTKGRVVGSVVGDAVDAAMRLIAGAEPQKTVKAYKLFKQEGGKLYPLFVGANEEVPMNQWVKATAGPQAASGKVKSKIGELAYRPGWHAGDLPIATHIGAKSHGDPSLPPDTRPSNQVWGEVEMANDVDWQKVANERARMTKKGTPDPKTAHITDQVPYGGYYRYKTNPNMTGEWLIGGDMRVNRVLTDDEVRTINEAAGVSDLPRREGYGPGGVIDDIVKMAGKIVSGADEPAKTGIRAYHGTPHDFDKFDISKIGTGEGAQAYGHGLYFAEKEGVARGYRDALSGKQYVFSPGPDEVAAKHGQNVIDMVYNSGGDPREIQDTISRLRNAVSRDLADFGVSDVSQLKSSYDGDLASHTIRMAQNADALEAAIKAGDVKLDPGHMYEVNINADPNQFLDWDKPLSEQPESVLSIARPFFSDGLPTTKQYGEIVKGSDLYDMLVQRSGGVMHSPKLDAAGIPSALPGGTKERLGQYLAKQGIPGIKYLDAGSRGAGEGTRNYVVFDDKLISIIRKYGIAGASAMLGYNLMEQLDPKQALAASMADQDYQSSRPQRSMGGNNSVSGALNVARGLQGGM